MGENHFASVPAAVYGVVLLFSGIAYVILQGTIIAEHGKQSKLALAVGSDLLYAAAIPLAFVREWIADAIYVGVVLMWLVPDRRIESRLQD